MRFVAAAVISVALMLLSASGSQAASLQRQPTHAVRVGTIALHLVVAGNPAKGTTYWVSYGPLGGRFGVVRLSSSANHLYSAQVKLPLDEPGTFTFLQAQGTEMVHGIPQPGGIPIVIRRMQAVTAVMVSQRVVHWSVPLG